MPTSRETFLQRVREAVQAGNRAGAAPPPEPRGDVGYQGAGTDLAAHFRDAFLAAGGQPYFVTHDAAAAAKVLEIVTEKGARRILLGGPVPERLALASQLRERGVDVAVAKEQSRDDYFEADIGISGADFLVAETGSIVVRSRPEEPRSLSLLPPIHIVVADKTQLVPDLFDLFDILPNDAPLPSGLTIITGPSKTGDIELRLVTGVHGPGEVHLVLIG